MQDLVFIVIMMVLVILRKHKLFVATGVACLVMAIPLFSFWIFFTAQRLTYYAAAFFLVAVILFLIQVNKK